MGPALLPFTGTPHIQNLDYVVTVNTPQFSRFSGSLFYLWGRDENFFEWSPADVLFATYSFDWRPNDSSDPSWPARLTRAPPCGAIAT